MTHFPSLNSLKHSLLLALTGLLLLASAQLHAHAFAPSLLSLQQQPQGTFEVIWKQPLKRQENFDITPQFPDHCRPLDAPKIYVEGTGKVQRWQLDCSGEQAAGAAQTAQDLDGLGLKGQTLSIDSLELSRRQVLVRVSLLEQVASQKMLNAKQTQYIIPADVSQTDTFVEYIELGAEHLLLGLDHVLFVITLTLLVGINRRLLWTITSFTLGHSVTLTLASLGYISFPQSLTEILIAASIVFMAAQLARNTYHSLHSGNPDKQPSSSLLRFPTLAGFGFGLLHGLGFAGALSETGLPANDIPLALLAFNIGIELAQLALVGFLLLCISTAQRCQLNLLQRWYWLPIYSVGGLAGFWFWQRLLG